MTERVIEEQKEHKVFERQTGDRRLLILPESITDSTGWSLQKHRQRRQNVLILCDKPVPGLEKSFLCQSQNFLECHFSGRIFFYLGRNRAPRLESLGAKKKKEKEAILEAIFCTHPDTNIINEMIASSFFFDNENR